MEIIKPRPCLISELKDNAMPVWWRETTQITAYVMVLWHTVLNTSGEV